MEDPRGQAAPACAADARAALARSPVPPVTHSLSVPASGGERVSRADYERREQDVDAEELRRATVVAMSSRSFTADHACADAAEHSGGGGESTLTAFPAFYDLNDPAGVTVSWVIREETLANDWIGLYLKDETDPGKWIDFRNRGVNGAKQGQIVWHFDHIEGHFTAEKTEVCFKYYYGKTGCLRATTQVITVSKNMHRLTSELLVSAANEESPVESSVTAPECVHIIIKDLRAAHLRKGMFFNPDPYIKLWLQPAAAGALRRAVSYLDRQHHTSVCENTTEPKWAHEEFAFRVRPTDLLMMKLKDKFVSSRPTLNRFLGMVIVPVRSLLEKEHPIFSVKFPVTGRSPSDHVCGNLFFTVEILKGVRPESATPPFYQNVAADGQVIGRLRSIGSNASASAVAARSAGHLFREAAVDASEEEEEGRGPSSELGYETDSSGDDRDDLSERSSAARRSILDLTMRDRPAAGSCMASADVQTAVWSFVGDGEVGGAGEGAEGQNTNDGLSCVGQETASVSQPQPVALIADRGGSQHGSQLLLQSSEEPAYGQNHESADCSQHPGSLPLSSLAAAAAGLSLTEAAAPASNVQSEQRRDQYQMRHQLSVDESLVSNAAARHPALDRDVSAAAIGKEPRFHSMLSGSLSVAAMHPGKLTSALLRSSSPRPIAGAGSSATEGLPAGWEARVDVHGRTFYIDHLNRKTTWIHPTLAAGSAVGSSTAAAVRRVPSLSHEQVRQMDERYRIVRRLTAKERSISKADTAAAAAATLASSAAASASSSPACGDTEGVVEDKVWQAVAGAAAVESQQPPVVINETVLEGLPQLQQLLPSSEADGDSHDQSTADADYLRVPAIDSRPVTPIDDVDDEMHSLGEDAARRTSIPDDGAAEASPSSGNSSSPRGARTEALADASPERVTSSVEWPPAVKLLLRSDFFSLVQYNDESQKEFLRNVALKHMVHKIRRSPETFSKYMHNRDLVAFLNKFALRDRQLPAEWEMKLDKHRKPFFVDHKSRTTSYIDPRLPTDMPTLSVPVPLPLPQGRRRRPTSPSGNSAPTPDDERGMVVVEAAGTMLAASARIPRRGSGSASEPETVASSPSGAHFSSGDGRTSRRQSAAGLLASAEVAVPLAYDAKVVAFLRQDGIMDVLQQRSPTFHKSEPLKRHVTAIINEGSVALQRYRNNLDLTMLLSLFEQDIMAYIPQSLLARVSDSAEGSGTLHSSPGGKHHHMVNTAMKSDFQEKYRLFHQKLHSKGYGAGPAKIKMRVRRDHLLQDSYNKIMACSKRELQKSKLLISFEGEEGLDYGGPAREFFFLFSREIFNPYYGLFEYSANDMYTVQISPVSQFVDMASEWFRFAGRMIGLCILHQYLMDCYFTRPFYKMLLKQACDLTDLESLDAEFHQSLLWMRDNDITDCGLDLTFSVDEEVFGQVAEHELKAGGRSLAVTEKNKKEYIERMVKWRVERGIADQKDSLLRGFHEVIDPKVVAIFDAKELELVIAGSVEINVADWRANTEYRSGYYDGHSVIMNYWKCIDKFDNEQRLRLLQFVTGTSSIPFEGFVALRGSNGPRRFTIERWGDPESLPRAHTCFNRLDLPPYTLLETMMEKLRVAIEETGTFGVE